MIDPTNQQLQLEVLAALPDPVFVMTESGRYAAMLGGADYAGALSEYCPVGQSLHDTVTVEEADWFLGQIRGAIAEDRTRIVEYRAIGHQERLLLAAGDGRHEPWFEGRITPIPSLVEGERAVLWLASDISRRHALQAELKRRSETDEVTGVYNRRKLIEALALGLAGRRRRQPRGALIIFDIDHFKRVNDEHGHLVGDDALRRVAALSQAQLADDDLLARFGGEEFAVLMPGAALARARETGERIRRAIAAGRLDVGARGSLPLRITVSVGVCEVRDADRHVDDLIRRADQALYRAKHAGRNRTETESPGGAEHAAPALHIDAPAVPSIVLKTGGSG